MLLDMKLPAALTEPENFEVELFSKILPADASTLPLVLAEAAAVICSRKSPVDIGHWLPVLGKVENTLPGFRGHATSYEGYFYVNDALIAVLNFLKVVFSAGYNKRYFLSIGVIGDIMLSADTIQLATIAGIIEVRLVFPNNP